MILHGAIALSLLASAGVATPADAGHAHYVITELGTIGGTASAGNSVNNRGWIAGAAARPGGEVTRATLWRGTATKDLGTLGGPNSAVLWPNKNDTGIVVGIAETAALDPLGESWSCSAFFPGNPTGHVCRGFVWERGKMRALPTFGGTHGFATGVNNRGHIVGWAELPGKDPSCNPPQVLGFRAAMWDLRRHRVRQLPPLPGDTASAATAVNDLGQAVGISGSCDNAVGRFSARRVTMWENGEPKDLGSLGSDAWNTAMAINRRGVVVGFANRPDADGGAFDVTAFRWTRKRGIHDLGALPGDRNSQALGVNDRGHIVGVSGGRAVLWRNGGMADLNELTRGYEGVLASANDINDAGVITGQAISAETGESVAFRAAPADSAG